MRNRNGAKAFKSLVTTDSETMKKEKNFFDVIAIKRSALPRDNGTEGGVI